jgi:NAD(P)-dependent dehydrogenase (short-subunit alcohol dehydrogenase family)
MEISDRVVVVTGGASGIGRALAMRCAAEGARGVVVADLDGDGAAALAQQIGPAALGIGCDVRSSVQVDDLIDRAQEAFGPVDLFCANAGVATGTGLDTPDDVWDRVLDVNVRAHVLAARRLVPDWVERGEGYFLATASAAGLITTIGDAPYSVSKHAAVAFAEWLAVTYGARGLRVSCLCPMGVNTPLLHAGLPSVSGERSAADLMASVGAILEPDEVAGAVVDALRDERFLVLPHPEVLEFFRRKASDYDRWIAGMQRLQARVAVAGREQAAGADAAGAEAPDGRGGAAEGS